MSEQIAIKVDNVSKDFRLVHEKNTTLKSKFTSLIKGKGSGKSTTKQHALKNISFEVKKGEFFGIVGRNGSGKSTMLKILAEIYQPTNGNIKIQGKLVPFIELGVGFNPELTGRENVYLNGAILGFSKKEIDGFYESVVDFAELEQYMDKKLKNYSSGMQVRLAFSMAIRADADILLIDEVLAVGDADFQRKCFEYFKKLKKNKKTVVFVSHDMNAVKEYCDKAMLIDEGRVASIGNPQKISKNYALLFIDDQFSDESLDKSSNTKSIRWGTKKLEFQNVNVSQSNGRIYAHAEVMANDSVEGAVYGIHISGSDGHEITATNNRYLDAQDIHTLNMKDNLKINWDIQNIFTDGKYYITFTLVSKTDEVFDWFTDALVFRIKRTDKSTTSVLPNMSVKLDYTK